MFPGEVLGEKREETEPIERVGTNTTRNSGSFSRREASSTIVIGALLHHIDEHLLPPPGLLLLHPDWVGLQELTLAPPDTRSETTEEHFLTEILLFLTDPDTGLPHVIHTELEDINPEPQRSHPPLWTPGIVLLLI